MTGMHLTFGPRRTVASALVTGSGSSVGKDRRPPNSYFLRYAFIADSVETDGVSYRLSGGADVADMGPGVQLDFLPWFPDFKKAASNFSLGLSRIPEDFVRHFEALAAADATS